MLPPRASRATRHSIDNGVARLRDTQQSRIAALSLNKGVGVKRRRAIAAIKRRDASRSSGVSRMASCNIAHLSGLFLAASRVKGISGIAYLLFSNWRRRARREGAWYAYHHSVWLKSGSWRKTECRRHGDASGDTRLAGSCMERIL